jgi:hypothetical protein
MRRAERMGGLKTARSEVLSDQISGRRSRCDEFNAVVSNESDRRERDMSPTSRAFFAAEKMF